MKESKIRLLFVCTINRMRSATAHTIFEEDNRFDVKSAGTSAHANNVLNDEMLKWADTIVVMEKSHRNFIQKNYREIYNSKKIICLYIKDEYDYMQPELIAILKERMDDILMKGLLS
ncbi:putative protein tyrosine phosphatase [Solitalea canadensis DSM 3403]|uniref:Protein-tyrosine-phosphatase n=2 Tax=Solitalea canadensis TaxID=995 RepID=H8KNN0_SOLCM|nr:putative protein tyrosine phosphatase [Solitalea canadensis DSM 3403]